MDPAPQRPVRSLPRKFVNKHGQPVRLQAFQPRIHQALVEMYLAFEPRNSFQGLPPINDKILVRWVEDMVRTGINLIACPLASETPIQGHIALFPVNPRKCEMLVVVSPPFQNAGIGTELVRACVEVACELGFERIWLPVAAKNLRARHVYRKCGFQYVSDRQSRELDMMLDLDCHRRNATCPPATAQAFSPPLSHVGAMRFAPGGTEAGMETVR